MATTTATVAFLPVSDPPPTPPKKKGGTVFFLGGLPPEYPMMGPVGWRPLFLSVSACCVYSLGLWAGALYSYPFVLVAPILLPSGLAASVRIHLCFLRLFSGPLGFCACCAYALVIWASALCSYSFVLVAPIFCPLCWRPLFIFVCACPPILCRLGWRPLFLYVCTCCVYCLALWAGGLLFYPSVHVALILWPSAPAPSVPIRLCLLRLFSGLLGWRPLFVSICASCACFLVLWAFVLAAPILWRFGLAPSVPIRLCLLRLFPGPLGERPLFIFVCACPPILCRLGWRPLFLYVCTCCVYSLALWAGGLLFYPSVHVALILWPSAPAPSVPIRLCLLRLFSGPLGWRPLFLFVCACCAYFPGPLGWRLVPVRFCLLRLFSGVLGWRPPFLFVCAPILWPSG